MISRRCFARDLAVGVFLAPLHASADTARKLRRIGLLSPDSRPADAELRETWGPLRKHGWIDVARKRADLLHELLPSAQRIGVMVDPTSPIDRLLREETDAAYRKLRLQPIYIEVTRAGQLDEALAEAGRRHVEALVATLPFTDARTVAQSATRYRLPTVVAGREMLDAGGIMSFTYNLQDLERRVAVIIDKILRGARPADVPIEQPTRFTLLINARTARDLGITVPRLLLMRADEVIQ